MNDTYIYHKIGNGETLESIAKQYGISAMRLVKLNNGITNADLKSGDFVIVGQKESDRIEKVEQQRQEAIEEKEETKKEEKSVNIPEQWLTDEQARKMALELIADNALELEALAAEKKRSLQKLAEQRVQNQDDYYKEFRNIHADVKEQQSDFVQDAIKKGIGRSSIVKSVNDEYKEQGDKLLNQLDRQASLDNQKMNNQQREIVRQYNQDVAQSNQKYQQQLDKAIQSIKEKNQDANIDIAVSNGIDNAVEYQIADRLLGTLSKTQAVEYLNKNQKALTEAWGEDAVEKLYKKYR